MANCVIDLIKKIFTIAPQRGFAQGEFADKIVRLKGGLGNQMFQYAYGKAIEHFTGAKVLYDPYWFDICHTFENCTARALELSYFNVDMIYATKELIEDYEPFLRQDRNRRGYNKKLMYLKEKTLYEGYFQGEDCIKEIREQLLKDFELKEPPCRENLEVLGKIVSSNSVSLHIRRGDYLKYIDAHGICSLEYYKKAINYIAKRVSNPHFFLFSDDIAWVVANLKIEQPFTVVDINSGSAAVFDLNLMKHCKHNIVANSSFSWWGAWLNENEEKIVIGPKRWFADKKIPETGLVPNWFVRL